MISELPVLVPGASAHVDPSAQLPLYEVWVTERLGV